MIFYKIYIKILLIAILLSFGMKPLFADQITLFVPAFEGPGSIGRNVATVLNLRIWSSFRRKPWPNNPKSLDFGKGQIIWDHNPLKLQSHQEAETIATSINVLAQAVLWGNTHPYGNGYVVQTYMSIPKYNDYRLNQNELWKTKIDGDEIVSDIPRRRFEVSSILLKSDIVKKYSLPSSLILYKTRNGNEAIGFVGNSYRGIQLEPKAGLAKIITNDVKGWVKLPELAKNPTEVSDFVGGLIKIYRSDWQGAISSMKRVLLNKNTKTPLKIDALLYIGLAYEKQGVRGIEYFNQAMGLNPYAKRSVRYLIMSDLSQLEQLIRSKSDLHEINKMRSTIKRTLKKYQKLFSKKDRWLRSVNKAINGYI